jgi:hypothetical protein
LQKLLRQDVGLSDWRQFLTCDGEEGQLGTLNLMVSLVVRRP